MDRHTATSAIVVLALLVPVGTWWLVGDLSSNSFAHLDYMVRPLPLTELQETALGWTALVGAVLATSVVAVQLRGRVVRVADVRFGMPLLLAGLYCGVAWRVVTAGGIGANIGGGMMIIGLPIVLFVTALWTVLWRPPAGRGSTRP